MGLVGIKYSGGSSTNNVAVMRDTNPADPFDGTNSYHTYYDTTWKTFTANDLYMVLKEIDATPTPYPIIHMNDTTSSGGLSVFSGRQIQAEFADSSSQLIGDKIDSITLKLRKTGTPTGTAQIGIFNADLSVKKLFGTVDVSTLTGVYADKSITLASELYTIQPADRIGIKYTGGDASNYVAVMRDTDVTDPFDGAFSYHTYYDTIWKTFTGNDLTMILKQTHH